MCVGVSDILVCIRKDAVIPAPLPDGNAFSIDRARLKSYIVAFLRLVESFSWSLERSRQFTSSKEFGLADISMKLVLILYTKVLLFYFKIL